MFRLISGINSFNKKRKHYLRSGLKNKISLARESIILADIPVIQLLIKITV